MDETVLSRVLHILGVIVWIGGVAFATSVVLPAVRRGALGADRLAAFRAVERRFVWQARAAVLLVGLTGLHMTVAMDLWDRFRMAEFWWMHAMAGVWLLFTLVLFVVEPFFLHRRFERWARSSPDAAFAWLHRAHWLLLTLGLVTAFGAAAGSHGWFFA